MSFSPPLSLHCRGIHRRTFSCIFPSGALPPPLWVIQIADVTCPLFTERTSSDYESLPLATRSLPLRTGGSSLFLIFASRSVVPSTRTTRSPPAPTLLIPRTVLPDLRGVSLDLFHSIADLPRKVTRLVLTLRFFFHES